MNFREVVTLQDIKELFDYALQEFYAHDKILLDYDTEEKAVSERCIVFHIGWYMLQKMSFIKLFDAANLDCEYNRNFNHPKSMYKQTLNNINKKIKDAVPDLLIHNRKSNASNLLVVEFKKGEPTPELKKVDIEKIPK